MKRNIILSIVLSAVMCAVLCAVLCLGVSNAAAQSCPTLTIYSPDTIAVGSSLKMSLNVSGGGKVTPTYNWSVSSGTITSGQGTSTITIEKLGAGEAVTGTVEIGGFDRSCAVTKSTTTIVDAPMNRKIDEFGAMNNTEDQYARLDNLSVELNNDPASSTVLLFYAGRTSRIGAIEALTNQTKKYLITRGIAASRILPINGGFREQGLIEMWLVPANGGIPYATPTVDPSEVKQLPALKTKPIKKPVKKPTKKT